MPFTEIDILPDPPQRTQDEETFAPLADAFVVALKTMSEQLNAFQSELEATAALIAVAPAYADVALKTIADSSLTPATDKLMYFSSASAAALADFTTTARTLLAQSSQANMRTTGLGMTGYGSAIVTAADYAEMVSLLGLVIGTDVQGYDADLAAIAALTTTTFGRSVLTEVDGASLLSTLSGQEGLTFTSNANGYAIGIPIGETTYYLQFATGGSSTTTEGSQTINWPVTFGTACLFADVGTKIASAGNSADHAYQIVGTPGTSSATVYLQRYGGGDWTNAAAPLLWGFGH